MRHHRKTQNLSRFSSYYKATVLSLVRGMLINQRIMTTKLRAKLSQGVVERLISLGKQMDSLAARRQAYSLLGDHDLVKQLFTQIGPMFAEKTGGYTRIIPYKNRRGDNAEMVIMELTVRKAMAKPVTRVQAEKADNVIPAKKSVSKPAKERDKTQASQPPKGRKKLGGIGKIFKKKSPQAES